ncbi:MAG: hypothetical protein ACQEXQ_10175 [Bacillota bacterium]
MDPGVDTLARWMAHYIAEQIEIAEQSAGIEKKEAEERCSETILKLWNHRSALPGETRPFVKFEPILRTLKSLDPENERNFFFGNRDNASESVPDEIKKWLDVAKGIDEAVRIWLKYVFKQAALAATDESTIEWLENAAALQEEDHFPVIFRDLHSDTEIWEDGEEAKDIERRRISSNISKLEAFAELNQILLADYKRKLEEA